MRGGMGRGWRRETVAALQADAAVTKVGWK
jgi:hypothetical protein